MAKLDNDAVVDVLAINGIDAIINYMAGDRILDPRTSLLWDNVREFYADLVEHLERQTGRDLDDE